MDSENEKKFVKPIGKRLNDLVERIQEAFEEKYCFKPTIVDVTNMIADAINKKGIKLL